MKDGKLSHLFQMHRTEQGTDLFNRKGPLDTIMQWKMTKILNNIHVERKWVPQMPKSMIALCVHS